MPDYKRKKVKKSFLNKKKHKNAQQMNNIVMHNSSKKQPLVPSDDNIKVVRGAKLKRKRRLTLIASIAAFLVTLFIVLSIVLPVSVSENLVNLFAQAGQGSYPIKTSGTEILNTASCGSYYYLLTDTNISVYSNGGKIIFSEQHGFENPIITVSETRALVFDQGGTEIQIYNLSGKIHSLKTENCIINADISRSGGFAVVTDSADYTSTVDVYNKKFNKIYTWNSAKNFINNIVLSSNGKKLAVSTLNATSGDFTTKVLIFNFESADPLHTIDLDNSIVLSFFDNNNGFSIITSDKYRYVDWSDFKTKEISSDGQIEVCRDSANGVLLVFNRTNDRSDNNVVLISNKGEKISEFNINTIITDIRFEKGRIYYVSDSVIYILDNKGNVLRKNATAYGTEQFAVTGTNSIAAVTTSEIIKTEIEKED